MTKIVEKFIKTYGKELSERLNVTPNHIEGTYLSHILLVYKEAENANASKIMKISALLHDIAKPECEVKNPKTGHIMTTSHENYGVQKAIKFLFELYNSNEITPNELERILYIINYHGIFWQKSEKQIKKYFKGNKVLFHDLVEFSIYDRKGRIAKAEDKSKIPDIEFSKNDIDEEKPTIHLFCGVAGIGKDYYIENDEMYDYMEILSHDDLMMETYSDRGTYSETYNSLTLEERDKLRKMFSERFKALREKGKDFVINLTNLNWKDRKSFFNKKFNYELNFVLTDIKTHNERLKNREGKSIPENVIENMRKKIELPLFGEFDNIKDVRLIIT